jgi:transposase
MEGFITFEIVDLDAQDAQVNENEMPSISTNTKQKRKPRGKYEKSTELVRTRVISAAENGEDWVAVATANGVKKSTADKWVRKGTAVQKSRGGMVLSTIKMKGEHVDFLIDKLNENSLLTLNEMSNALQENFNLRVSLKTISRHLEGRMITLKGVHYQPIAANSLTNKRLMEVSL